MSWIALVLTLLLEQVRAMPTGNLFHSGAVAWSDEIARRFNAGAPRHGVYAWLLVAGAGTLVSALLYELAHALSWPLALALDVAVLFTTLGFRQFSHPITRIQEDLAQGRSDLAHRHFIEWRRAADPDFDPTELSEGEIARQSMEFGLVAAHRHVFGVMFWFLVLPGPSGAVLYRLAEYLARHWNHAPVRGTVPLPADRFGEFAQRAFAWIDWLPVRLTALAYAIVGDFEGALHCWRHVTVAGRQSGDGNRVLMLAAASGALGVRILGQAETARCLAAEAAGDLAEPGPDALRSAVGLVWRALVLWMVLLLLLTLASGLH
jgi:adenosylcobinamide-phosphate synthase